MKLKILSLAFALFLSGCIVINQAPAENKDIMEKKVNSFEDCVQEGNAVMESYPRQCRSKAGDLFVEEIKDLPVDDKQEEVFCVEVYDPVCGQIEVQCIKAPCDPIWQTFSNECFANKAKAKNIKKGACEGLDS